MPMIYSSKEEFIGREMNCATLSPAIFLLYKYMVKNIFFLKWEEIKKKE